MRMTRLRDWGSRWPDARASAPCCGSHLAVGQQSSTNPLLTGWTVYRDKRTMKSNCFARERERANFGLDSMLVVESMSPSTAWAIACPCAWSALLLSLALVVSVAFFHQRLHARASVVLVVGPLEHVLSRESLVGGRRHEARQEPIDDGERGRRRRTHRPRERTTRREKDNHKRTAT